MPVRRRAHHQPKHLAEPVRSSRIARPRVMWPVGAAVAVAGLVLSGGLVRTGQGDHGDASGATDAGGMVAADRLRDVDVASPRRVAPAVITDRATRASRSDLRTRVDEVKRAALDQRQGGQVSRTEDVTSRDPRTVARAMLGDYGFGGDQFACLDSLYDSESGWNVHADNPSSSAYGIPQALPGSKMSSAGPDWQDNPVTQIRWGLGYIKARYGTPCEAWSFKQGNNWY